MDESKPSESKSNDSKPKKKKSNKMRNLLIDLATLFVIVVVAVLAFIIFGQADGESSTGGRSIQISSLKCEKSGTDNPFLRSQYIPISGQHSVIANFKDGNLTDAMYKYTAVYSPSVNLSAAKTNMHVEFDLAYGNALVHRDGIWTEGFSTSDDNHELVMTIYSEAGNLRSSNAEAFMLPTGREFPKTIDTMESAYEAEGFSCQVSE